MSKTQTINVAGHTVHYINERGDRIDEYQLAEQIELGDRKGTLYMYGYIIPIGTWWITDWKEIAKALYMDGSNREQAMKMYEEALNQDK